METNFHVKNFNNTRMPAWIKKNVFTLVYRYPVANESALTSGQFYLSLEFNQGITVPLLVSVYDKSLLCKFPDRKWSQKCS